MAKKSPTNKATTKKQKSFEQTLWDTADKLRGSVESSEYKHVILSLIFLKFVSDKFEVRKQELIDEGQGDYVDMVEFYAMKNVFYLPEESRWSYIQKQAKQDDIAVKIDTALHTVEKNNKALRGALPDNYFSRLGLDQSKLAALIGDVPSTDPVAAIRAAVGPGFYSNNTWLPADSTDVEGVITRWQRNDSTRADQTVKKHFAQSIRVAEGNDYPGDWVQYWGDYSATDKESGKPFTVKFLADAQVKDGKLVKIYTHYDRLSIFRQLGKTPPEAEPAK